MGEVRLKYFKEAEKSFQSGLIEYSADMEGIIRAETLRAWVEYYVSAVWNVDTMDEIAAIICRPDPCEPCGIIMVDANDNDWVAGASAALKGHYLKASRIFSLLGERLVARNMLSSLDIRYGKSWAEFYATTAGPRRIPKEEFDAVYQEQEKNTMVLA